MGKNRIIFLTILALVVVAVLGCGGTEVTQEDKGIVKIFKELDARDFEAQNLVQDKAASEKIIREIYTEPQLQEALQYLEEMRKNQVKLVHYNTEYKNIEVLEENDTQAKLRVQAVTTGAYYTTNVPETKLGPLNHESKYEVLLKKVDGKWKIAEVTYLEEQSKVESSTGENNQQ